MAGKLTFGYLYDFRRPPGCPRDFRQIYAETLDLISWSEQAGFGGAWVPEHHAAPDGYMPSPIVALAAIAARTSRITIGSGVALAPLYHPVRFAEDCAVLDTLSGGRLEMSLAIGYRRRESATFGVDFGKRGKIFDEFLDIVRRLWAGETVNHRSAHFSVENAAIAPVPATGKVPLWIGGFAARALERVARHADGYFGNEECVPAYLEQLAAAGRDPADAKVQVPGLFVAVARDPEAAMEELAPYYHYVNSVYGDWGREDNALGTDSDLSSELDLDAFKASGILHVWTPEEAVAKLRAMRDRIPLTHYVMMMPPGLPPERFIAHAEVFASDVMPAFA